MLKFFAKCFLGSAAVVAGVLLAPVIIVFPMLLLDSLSYQGIKEFMVSGYNHIFIIVIACGLVELHIWYKNRKTDNQGGENERT